MRIFPRVLRPDDKRASYVSVTKKNKFLKMAGQVDRGRICTELDRGGMLIKNSKNRRSWTGRPAPLELLLGSV